ncbi:MAG: hypothetical protein AABX38_04150 [Candidatus Micrarchaeota archaeon]
MGKEFLVGKKLGVLFPALSVLCAALIYVLPAEIVANAVSYLTHATFVYTRQPFNILNIAIGAAIWSIFGFVTGVIYEKISEYFER